MVLGLSLFDVLGLVGAALFVTAYAGVQFEKLDPHALPALMMNFVGAILVLISLTHAFNLAAFIMESIWGLVAVYGLIKLALRRRH